MCGKALRLHVMPEFRHCLQKDTTASATTMVPGHNTICFATALPAQHHVLLLLQQCERALTKVKPGQRVNCLPGVQNLAGKGRLIATLTQHYGQGAFELTPRSWLLPDQYWHWRLWAETQVQSYLRALAAM